MSYALSAVFPVCLIVIVISWVARRLYLAEKQCTMTSLLKESCSTVLDDSFSLLPSSSPFFAVVNILKYETQASQIPQPSSCGPERGIIHS
jgi:hypothetical protein